MAIWVSKVAPLTTEYCPVVGFFNWTNLWSKAKKILYLDDSGKYPLKSSCFAYNIFEFSVSRRILWYPYFEENIFFACTSVFFFQKRNAPHEFKWEKHFKVLFCFFMIKTYWEDLHILIKKVSIVPPLLRNGKRWTH